LQLGSVDPVGTHVVDEPGPLSVTLVWSAPDGVSGMRAPIVRGAPYVTVEYAGLAPNVTCQQPLAAKPKVDGSPVACDGSVVLVKREVELFFESDNTWLVFVSAPTKFVCKTGHAGDGAGVSLAATAPMKEGVVRAALLNNWQVPTGMRGATRRPFSNLEGFFLGSTTGSAMYYCDWPGHARDQSEYGRLLRKHADVYPTGAADIGYLLPHETNLAPSIVPETAVIEFKWGAKSMQSGIPRPASATDAATAHAAAAAAAAAAADAAAAAEAAAVAAAGGKVSSKGGSGATVAATTAAAADTSASLGTVDGGLSASEPALLMYSLPTHRQVLTSGRFVGSAGAVRTLHGFAELVEGDAWSMEVPLHSVSFGARRAVRAEMADAVNEALDLDIQYDVADNYKTGTGDTYFSGKMLAKMARIALIAEEMGRLDDARDVAGRLKAFSEVWFNGSAQAPFLYDRHWGGIVSCGCDYHEDKDGGPATARCLNEVGPSCPGLNDPGQNFGAGFYNDHLFHYGYHIYAAAVVSKFFPAWGIEYYDRVMLLVRDLANPSPDDPFFPPFRHKDWYLGSSWALGIPTLGGVPYSNGRNEESSSEAVAGYDAIALYGMIMEQVFLEVGNRAHAQSCAHVQRTASLLLSTEIHASQMYWHVRPTGSAGSVRIYPEGYRPHVVGMLWSTLAQMQTWFGGEAWKIYGIQMLPLLPISEVLLEKPWIEELLPDFEASCILDTNPAKQCIQQGWSVIYHCAQAIAGDWRGAWEVVSALPGDVYPPAG
ncbi:unnamed protein product, partial [Phaeothamnion confervicola]